MMRLLEDIASAGFVQGGCVMVQWLVLLRVRHLIRRVLMMNFAALMVLHAQQGNDRNAIAKAIGITVEQINQWQMQAVADAQKCGGADKPCDPNNSK